ncbi:glycosyltransferase [Pseudobdellovibrio exovorus]|uniref:Uncharacterized protein n=1 Tax=Pseudobdellovibrio exovorus JSS TaxID=1184267 RepID=M4V8G0_9BACT|nr:glycosyltransferase [Pseudobdellovibrio exovorus]AGH95682.1 hypothetical protein A11Q_1466 [Pseudobdellovibrio exovorus JSS]
MKIARVVTVPEAFVHIRYLLKYLVISGCDVTLVSSPGEYGETLKNENACRMYELNIAREINLISDLISVFKLIFYFRKEKFDIVHSSTPKAGLLCAVAGIFVPHTVFIHTFTGQRWATLRGPLRALLKFLDKLVIRLNSKCYADSFSQIKFLEKENVAAIGQIECLHKGSYGGIDCERFDAARFPNAREALCERLGLQQTDILLLFVGRLTKDKGVEDLVAAFIKANKFNSRIKLVLLGKFEPELDPLNQITVDLIHQHKDVFYEGFSSEPERYFSACDFLCLPSYREGFGTVIIEAASCGLPSIGTRIPGLEDAIVDGETGLLVKLGEVDSLTESICRLAIDETLRKKMAQLAQDRAKRDYSTQLLSKLQVDEYIKLTGRQA